MATVPPPVSTPACWLASSLRVLSCLLLAGILTVLTTHLQAQSIPSGGLSLVGVADIAVNGGFRQGGTSGAPVAVRTLVPISGKSFSQAAHIDVQNPNTQYWSSVAYSPSTRAVAKDDVLLAHLFIRAISTTDETGSVFCQIFVEGPSPSYTKSISQEVRAGSEWVEYFIPFTALENYSAGQFTVNLGFGAGSRPQVLEVAGVEVLWYGTSRTLAEMPRTSFQYEGRDPNAAWRAAAQARIEQYRKSNYSVRVVNAEGIPVPDANVHLKLKRHAFPFGVAFESRLIYNQSLPAHKTYADKIKALFNSASTGNDLKWGPWAGEWGSNYGKPVAFPALQLLKDDDFFLRGHVLVWPSFRNLPNLMQTPLTNTSPSVPTMITDHIHDEVTGAKHLIDEWDVLNEPYDNHDVMDRYGNAVMVDWFKQARADHPGADLYINEYAILSGGGNNTVKQDFYENTVRYLLDNGAPVTGMGFQSHFDGSPTGITKVLSVIDRYATAFPSMKFKVTEFDVVTTDEALQADYTRDFLTACFSHPRMKGFQFWGMWENDHWRPDAALYKADWTEKPNGAALRRLLKEEWTTDATKTSNDAGLVQGRAFKGLYTVDVTINGQTTQTEINIDDETTSSVITVAASVASNAPYFTKEPLGITVTPGETAVISCEAVGYPTPSLAWYQGEQLLAETGTTLTITNASSANEGTYHVLASNINGTTESRRFKVGVRTAEQCTERLVNISTRGLVLTGQSKMVIGFVVEGQGQKKLLLRGVGPRLADFGITSVAGDPLLSLTHLYSSDPDVTNDNWSNTLLPYFTSTHAFDLDTDTLSAGLLPDLGQGLYTADFSDNALVGGIGLVEAYDATPNDSAELINISTRGFVGTGQSNLVAGFCISGSVPKQVLIRGVGLPLQEYAVTGCLADPQLVLHEILPDGSPRVVTQNDDWYLNTNAQEISAAFTRTGAFALPAYSPDSALLVWLEPGNYTITLSGVGETTGIALVEVYAIPR